MPSVVLPRQIESGPGSFKHLGKKVKAYGGKRPVIIMDSFLASPPLNLHKRVAAILKEEELEPHLFCQFSGEPTTDHVDASLKALTKYKCDSVIAIGGGSAIDIAKATSVFGATQDLKWESIPSLPHLDRLPLFAVPTTAGTGSEATKVMVITNKKTNFKMNPGHPKLIPDAAILDPELTLSLPQSFTAFTGLDALTHAIEAYVSTRASVMTDLYAIKAIGMIGKSLPKVYENGSDIEKRNHMILGSCYAGIAFSNASTNLAHAMGRPLGAHFHIPHGLSVALLLPFVMAFSLPAAKDRFADIALSLGAENSSNQEQLAKTSVDIVHNFNRHFDIWNFGRKHIKNVEELKQTIPHLVEDALSGNGIETNRVLPTSDDIKAIYHSLVKKLSEEKVNITQ
ncbi:acetaldehyde reductase EutG [Scopulibacillus darangshiensis]|uniref:Acetaldehyde reductase EutG n=1 Tax=Scopulibacillus darangshiensis TaxID=442528 RepID=A0A4R2P5U4_9BACL|nr:iron-containing alcohol dehydrogenase [Scopulibacillus darangshiensis]TCP29578.1 acetaldehyde reductase EutG [Scopulibacillus darangshiensis]